MPKSYPKIWKPFTIQGDQAPQPTKVISGNGLWLTLEDGTEVMDLISSWWVNLHGHAHPAIAQAIADQANKLEHVIFAGFTHDPAEYLIDELIDLTEGTFQHAFFSDNGSTAVEVALKTAYQYWQNKGIESRKRVLAFEGAYHGDTVGAMSASSPSVFNDVFKQWMMTVDRVEYPSTWIGDAEVAAKEEIVLRKVKSLFESDPTEFAAILIEPLIQGAGGMNMCRPEFLQKLELLAKEFDVLVIYDEVMTGFGRTGSLFAYQKAGTNPDLICLSKGLTGGFLPMALTLSNSSVFQTFYANDAIKTLWHGHSYTGNPLGCAAAVASLSLTKAALPKLAQIQQWHQKGIESIAEISSVKRPRLCGTVAAVDIQTEGADGYLNSIGQTLRNEFIMKGMLVRPLGNVLYFMPPYCITEAELGRVYEVTREILK